MAASESQTPSSTNEGVPVGSNKGKRPTSHRAEQELRAAWEMAKSKEIPEEQYWDQHAQKRFFAETTKQWDTQIPAIRLEWTTSGTAQSFPALLDERRAVFDQERTERLRVLKEKRFKRFLDSQELVEQWATFRAESEEGGLLYSSSSSDDDDVDDDNDSDSDNGGGHEKAGHELHARRRKHRTPTNKRGKTRRKRSLSNKSADKTVVPGLSFPAKTPTAAVSTFEGHTGFTTPPSTARKVAAARVVELQKAIAEAKLKLVQCQEKYASELQRNRELVLISLGFEGGTSL